MRIDDQTHWYIIHFLAHKLVFESRLGQERHPTLCLHEAPEVHGKTLRELSKEFSVPLAQLQQALLMRGQREVNRAPASRQS